MARAPGDGGRAAPQHVGDGLRLFFQGLAPVARTCPPEQDRRLGVPLYNFHCPDCDNEFELLISASDTPVCPSCGSTRAEQMVSRIAPDQKLKAVAKAWRAQATKEGHTSNFNAGERKR